MKTAALKYASIVMGFLALSTIGTIAHVRHQAGRFLIEMQSLNEQAATVEHIELLSQRYGGARTGTVDSCEREECTYTFRFTNALLSSLGLSPRTVLGILLKFQHGRLVYRSLHYTLDRGYGQFDAVVLDFVGASDREPFDVVVERDGSGRPLSIVVTMTSEAEVGKRRQALSFNASCLARIGGCRDAGQMLPAVLN